MRQLPATAPKWRSERLLKEVFLFLSLNNAARALATKAPGARTMALRFVAGETVEDALRAARALNSSSITASLDYLGESVSNRAEARAAADVYIELLNRIRAEGLDANVSLKLTQMGQDIDEAFLHENIRRVLDCGLRHDIFIRLDMESSGYTQRTLDFFERIWNEGYHNVGVVLQSYLYRTEKDVLDANARQARVRLCKGAYSEPESVAFPEKAKVDENYVRLMQLLLKDGKYPGIATHDEAMIDATKRFARENGIPVSAFEFQMLYGVRRDLQQQLVREGYNLRVYVPFGGAWYAYLMRRLAERPANVFFIVNAVVRESPLGRLVRRRSRR
jgi:proline dehydrogenase